MGAASAAARLTGARVLRADERALVATAGTVFALASGGAAMTASAADALFLAELGPAHLGQAVAVSSALLAVVLAVVGGLSDRLERRRVLASLSFVSAAVIAGLAILAVAAPRAAAVSALIGGKQLAAATDLAFWVVIAERIDARRSQRMLPLLAATGGAGAAIGALLVIPIASAAGARGVLVGAAVLLAAAGLGASRLGSTRRVAAPPARVGALITRSWRDGARAVRRHPLAAHLAIVVGAAGVFGSLAYFALGVEVAARGSSTSEIAALLGGVRGGAQFVTLGVQLLVAPRLLARLGTGRALLLAPLGALAAGLGLVIAPVLAVAIATQMSARVLDASVETPAEKLAQTLLPTVVRGRVAGFLDGTAKRAGAVLGGVIAAMLASSPSAFYVVTAIAAALWLLAASRIARELPALAIEHVAVTDARGGLEVLGDGAVVDDRAVQALLKELDGTRPERAADVLARLHDAGRVDAVAPLVRAAIGKGSPSVWRSLVAVLDEKSEVHGKALLEAAQAATTRTRELAVRAVGLAGGVAPESVDQWRDPDAGSPAHEPEGLLSQLANAAWPRVAGDRDPAAASSIGWPRVAVDRAQVPRVAGDRDPAMPPRAVGDRDAAAGSSAGWPRVAGDRDLAPLDASDRDPSAASRAGWSRDLAPLDAGDRDPAAGSRAGWSRDLAPLDAGDRDPAAASRAGWLRVAGDRDPAAAPWPRVASDPDPAVALAAEVARLRLADDRDGVLAHLAAAAREGEPVARAAIDELVVEIARGLAGLGNDHALDAARYLSRALRRGRGDGASRTAGFAMLARLVDRVRAERSAELSLLRADLLELARERVEQGASKAAPETALVSLLHKPQGAGDEAAEVAAALRLYGELLEGADSIDPEDLRRVARALGEPDDEVRTAAEAALANLGPAAAGELIATAAWGRRRARDRAAALLADLPVTAVTIDRLVDAELDALEQTAAAIAVFGEPGDELLVRRLEERLREIAHTVLLLVSAQRRSRAIARAAVAWRHARAGQERARALAVIEAALPRALVGRLVEAVDDLTPADRAAALARAGIELPSRDAANRAELAGRDRLARALVLHTLGAAGRSAHRDTIAQAAQAEALAASATDLLRRLTEAVDDDVEEGTTDMPSRVETLIALGRVPLLASLSTRQLADVAERARWVTAREGSIVVTAGDPIDALIVVEDGELSVGDRRIGKGEVVDELACVAPAAASTDIAVVRGARMIRLERVDFEELVDDVPGLASAVCRALGERARKAEDASYRSPLASRSG